MDSLSGCLNATGIFFTGFTAGAMVVSIIVGIVVARVTARKGGG